MSPLHGVVTLLLLALQVQSRPQADADACIFDDGPDCELKPEINENCFDSVAEIDDTLFQGDLRGSFNDCDNSRKCSFYARHNFTCADAWTCNENRTIITDGKGLIDVRQADHLSLDASDGKCDSPNKVCCQRPNKSVNQPGNPRTQDTSTVVKEKPKWEQCGRSSEAVSVTGDSPEEAAVRAQPTEFPHMCLVLRLVNGQKGYVGGASLIARNKVLTVAHKFLVSQKGRDPVDLTQDPADFLVRCGDYNVRLEDEPLPSQETTVEEILIHPEYDSRRVYNNLAVLRTRENFFYQEHIGPVCLPRPFESFDNSKGVDCWSSGWGADAFGPEGVYSDNMKKVKLGVVGRQKCQRRLQDTQRFQNLVFKLHDSWMCIGGKEGLDTCSGDGGSPHVCRSLTQDAAKWTQVGAVAWGVECGNPVPAVYSSVPHAMCWIDWVMSCKPESDKFIDNLFPGVSDLLDLRTDTSSPDSVNFITEGDCQVWLDAHPSLADECSVRYTRIQERGNEEFLNSALFD